MDAVVRHLILTSHCAVLHQIWHIRRPSVPRRVLVGHAGILSNLWGLATFIPTLAISVRRLHDSNHPGTWLVLIYGLIFLGGGISGLDSLFLTDDTATGTVNLLYTLGLICSLAGLIIALVLFTAASDPEGEQYDEPDGNDEPAEQIFPE